MSRISDTSFPSPGSDASVIAKNAAENQEISFSSSDDPVPILASTAHRGKTAGENAEMINRILQLAEMAGSYLDSESGSDVNKTNNFSNYLKTDLPDNSQSSQVSQRPVSPKISLNETQQTTSEESSLSMLDMDHIAAGCSLVPVESNVSLGSWLGDMMPESSKVPRHSENVTSFGNQDHEASRSESNERFGAVPDTPRINSRYLLTDSQLDGFPDTPQRTPFRTIPTDMEQLDSSDVANESDAYSEEKPVPQAFSAADVDAMCSNDLFLPSGDDEKELALSSNCFGADFGEMLHLQQEVFGDEEFAENIADVLDQDEEKFAEDHRLMLDSNVQEENSSGMGFSTNDSPSKMEYFEPKLSIGTYIAARSDKMGKLGQDESFDRPSFGWKIRSPPSRHPVALQTSSVKSNDTHIDDSSGSISGQDDTLTKDTTNDGTLEVQPCEAVDAEAKNQTLDMTTDQDSLSLSAAMMNMSTSVSNEDLAREIIKIAKQKQAKTMEKRLAPAPNDSAAQGHSSSCSRRSSDRTGGKPIRKSRIPVGVKSPSPPKPVDIKKNSLSKDIRQRNVDDNTKSQSTVSSVTSSTDCQVEEVRCEDPDVQPVLPEYRADGTKPSLQYCGSSADTDDKMVPEDRDCGRGSDVTANAPSAPADLHNLTDIRKGDSTTPETERSWNNIMQESFMHDYPEQDVTDGKSVSQKEVTQPFCDDQESIQFTHAVSRDSLLSSTRTESSLLRGSLSRESIEQLHKKLRVQNTTRDIKPGEGPHASGTGSNPRTGEDKAGLLLNNKKKDLNEDTSWKTKEFANKESEGPLSQSSPNFQGGGRISGEFHEMLPSMTMSFGEMATIQEHQFDLHELDEKHTESTNDEECAKKAESKIQLDVITEEAETTQDTVLSNHSSGSGESQIPSELSHPAQHSTTVAPPTYLQTMPPVQNMYLTYQHAQPRLTGSMSASSLPNLYKPDSMYPRTMDGPHHSLPLEYFHSQRYPHPYSRFATPNSFTPHPAVHSSASTFGFDQPSMALSSDMALNHTGNTMYSQPGYLQPVVPVHAPRLPSLDGRYTPYSDMYHPQMQLKQFEGLIVPRELMFPSVRCVSLTSVAKLPLKNNSDRWLQADLNVLSPTIDPCFSVDGMSKPIVGPQETKIVDVTFTPRNAGHFDGILEVASAPVSSDGSCNPSMRPITTLVNLRASAENPKVELMGPDNKKMLDFGEVVCDGVKHLPLKIYNRGAADVPVCVIICTKSADRRCFAITESAVIDWQDQEKPNQSVLRGMVYSGSGPMVAWLHCKIPSKHSNTNEPPTNISGQVYLELDNSRDQSFDSIVLDTVAVEVIACVAKLHAPKNMQPLNFICARDSSQTIVMPVKNCANVSSQVAFSLQRNVTLFEISPKQALLTPGEQVEVSIKFVPQRTTPNKIQSTFLMKIEPNGTKYEITVNASCHDLSNVSSIQRQGFPDGQSSVLTDMPSLLTNKSHLCWGGVAVGQSMQQRVVLRTTSSGGNKTLPMRLMIKGADAACFQILREDDRNREELCSRQEIVMLPGHNKIVRILYGPTKCKITLAKLEIKAPVDQVPSTKFTIPLSGYGGRCDLKIDDLEILPKEDGKLYPSYIAHALSSEDDQMLTVKFTLKNNSSRHAFVKTVLYSDRECVIPHSANNAASPSHFILPKQSSRVVQVSLNKKQVQRTGYTRDGKELIGTLCLWHGEEVARSLLKNALGKFGPSAIAKCLSESNPLRSIAFDGIFEGENSIEVEEELEQVKPQFGDIQVFYSSIKKSLVEIFGPRTQKHLEMVEPGKIVSILDKSKVTNSHMHYKRPSKVETNGSTWEISPEHVILSVPNLSDSIAPSKIKIINKSQNLLKFDAAWSRNYLTVTPHCGHVDPESVLIVLLNANPSLATRRGELPWIGTVQISTHSGRDMKQLHVQIRDDILALDSSVQPTMSSPYHQLKARYSEPYSLDSFSTPMAISGSSRISEPGRNVPKNKIMLSSTVLEFGPVPVKSSSKSFLEFTNVSPSTIRWILTSFAPAYVKSVESTGDLYRTTYAAFIFCQTSGLLETGVKVQIPVTFSPVSEGQYSQFWDLEHHDATDSAAVSLSKVRIQVTGQGKHSSKGPQNLTATSTKGKEMYGIYVSESQVRFPGTLVGESSIVKIPVKNRSKESHNVQFVNVRPPFYITHQRHTIRPMSYACLPVTFKPTCGGDFESTLVIHADRMDDVVVTLFGRGV